MNIYDIPIALDHAAVPRLPRPDAGAEPRRRRRVPGDGGDADPHQVADAAAAARIRRRSDAPRRIRATRWCGGCSSTRSSRPPPSCCTSARRCAARSGRGPTARRRDRRRGDTSPSSRSISSACSAAFRQVLERAKQRPMVFLPPEQISIEDAHRAAARAAVGDRGVRLRGSVRRRRRSRAGLIVTFLALLEMIRLKLIRVFQAGGVRADSRLQARAAGRCAAPDWRSGGAACGTTSRRSGDAGADQKRAIRP